VRVIDAVRGARLAEHPRAEVRLAAQVGANELQRNDSVDEDVTRPVDDAHPPPADLLGRLVKLGVIVGIALRLWEYSTLRDLYMDETALLTNLRQQQAVSGTVAALARAQQATAASIPHEMLLLDLYEALQSLDALTGATTTDDILNLIFSTFCIGK